MAEIKVRFFGPVRSLVRKKDQVIFVESGATLRTLLAELGRSNHSDFRRYIVLEGNTLNPVLRVFVNGESIDAMQNLDQPLPSESIIDVMLTGPIMGG